MDKLIIALFETSFALVLFYLIYLWGLKKETFFRENRFYLLFAVLFSLIVPWINWSIPSQTGSGVFIMGMLDTVTLTAKGIEKNLVQKITAWQWVFAVYSVGSIVMLVSMLYKLFSITRIDKSSHFNADLGVSSNVRLIKAEVAPFSFLHRIYINPTNYTEKQLHEVIAHENIHVYQKHTYDCLFYELLIVFFWFNPIVYRYRKSAKEVHEYLADEGAIKSGVSGVEYQQLLFEQATGVSMIKLANSFNYSLTKKRLIMLSKIESSKSLKVRLLLVVPVVLSLLFVFACSKAEKETVDENALLNAKGEKVGYVVPEEVSHDGDGQVFFVVDEMPSFDGGDEALRKYIASTIVYPELAKAEGIQGRVFVQFVVNKQGTIQNVKVVRGVHKSLDEEAVRVLSAQPKWTPGYQNGEPVNVSFTVPINFQLN